MDASKSADPAPAGRVPGEYVTADDVLPMAEVVEMVKAQAWVRCCAKAGGLGWPVDEPAIRLIRMTPVVALMALVRLCPQVGQRRLARLLRIDPQWAENGWAVADHDGSWARETAAEIVKSIQGEG